MLKFIKDHLIDSVEKTMYDFALLFHFDEHWAFSPVLLPDCP